MMRRVLLIIMVFILVAASFFFNRHMIEIRFYEMNTHLINVATDIYASRTFNIISKYELIKRRIESSETDLENYTEEANLMVILASDTLPRAETAELASKWNPTRIILDVVRFLLGKEKIDYRNNEEILNKLDEAYVYERNRQYQNAIIIYDELLNSTELNQRTFASILMHKAFCLSFLSDYNASASIYLKVAQNYPDSPEGILSGKLYNFIKTMEKENIKINREEKNSHTIGKKLYSYMDYKGTIKQMDLYLQTPNPTQKNSAHFYKGRAHEEIGEYPHAIGEYNILSKLGRKNPWARKANRRLVMLGSFYKQKNSSIIAAEKILIKQGDTTFLKSIIAIQLLSSSADSETLNSVATSYAEEVTDISDSTEPVKKPGTNRKQKRSESVRNRDRKNNQLKKEQKRVREELKREEERRKALERKERLAQSPVRSAEFIKSTINSNTEELKKIYLHYISTNKAVSGELIMEMKIRANGKIDAKFISSTIEDRTFKNAVIDEIESWNFPPIDSELGTVKIRYPFSFSPQ